MIPDEYALARVLRLLRLAQQCDAHIRFIRRLERRVTDEAAKITAEHRARVAGRVAADRIQ